MASDDNKWEFGLWAVLMGVLGLVIAFIVIAWRWHDQTGIAALGAIASPIVAMVTAYFGIQYTQKATENAAKTTQNAELRANTAERGRAEDIEALRREILPKMEEAAKMQALSEKEAEGYAAKAWDDARSILNR